MKHIILCADDYGLNAGVSQGIVDLLGQKRLSAVSCMTTAPLWSEHAPWLIPFRAQADLGLHFNLTQGKPLSSLYKEKVGEVFYPLSLLIIKSFLRQLNLEALEQECAAQLQRFEDVLGFLPDFVDGHQHIQQLPQIREALLRVYAKRLQQKKAYIRSVFNTTSYGSKLKQGIIYLCGARRFRQLLKQQAIPHNTAFGGIYSFDQAAQYAQIFPQFLQKIPHSGLIMCHPGLEEVHDSGDVIAAARFHEYKYLSSEQFNQACAAQQIQIGRRI